MATEAAPSTDQPNPLGQLERPPIFVVGHMRSGTTWVFDVLSAHPLVAGIFESRIFTMGAVAPLLHEVHWQRDRHVKMFGRDMGLGQILSREEVIADLRPICDDWLARALEPQHRFLVEKSPADSIAVETFAALYPGAAVVHVLRDGRDVAVSTIAARGGWMRRDGTEAEPPPPVWRQVWSTGMAWAGQVKRLRELKTKLDLPFHEIRYEQMHAHPHEAARALFEFCGIPCDDGLLDEILERTHFSQLPKTGPESFRRSGRVGDWRREWSLRERVLFEAGAGEMLAELGYARPPAAGVRLARRLLLAYEKLKRVM